MNSRNLARGGSRFAALSALAAVLTLTAGLTHALPAGAAPAPEPVQPPTLAQLSRLTGDQLSARIARATRGPITYRWREAGGSHLGQHDPATRARRVDSSGGLSWVSVGATFCFSREWLSVDIPGWVLGGDPAKPWACGPRRENGMGRFLITRAQRVDPSVLGRHLITVPETRLRIVTLNGKRMVRARYGGGMEPITVWVNRRARIQRLKLGATVITVTGYRAPVALPSAEQRGPLVSREAVPGGGHLPPAPTPTPTPTPVPSPTKPPSTDPPPSDPT